MAFQLKHWLGVVALSAVVVAGWRLPLDSAAGTWYRQRSVSELRHATLLAELRMARTRLDQLRRLERLPARAVRAADKGVALLLPEEGSIAPETASALRDRITAEATTFVADPEMVVAYAYDGGGGGETGLAVSQGHRLETYVGEVDGARYCLQVVVTRPNTARFLADEDRVGRGWSRWSGSLLGPCVFYATYGAASASMQTWMEDGGSAFAFGHPFQDAPAFPEFEEHRLFGAGAMTAGPSAVGRCVGGDAQACATTFLDPNGRATWGDGWRERPWLPATFNGPVRLGPFPGEDWFMLADLEREFGTDAFRAFWKSEADVATAFRAAFGVDPGEWILTWLENGPGVERRPTAPPLSTTFAGLLTVALMTGLASTWHRRRRVA